MRIRNLDIGVESVSRWQVDDEFHLPTDVQSAPSFLPEYRALDSILARPSLDERLPDLLQPKSIDPDILHPSAVTAMREGLQTLFAGLAGSASPTDRPVFAAAAGLLQADTAMDAEVRSALAMLLRG